MKLFGRKPTIPDDPATEKQIDYITTLVLAIGPQSKPILKRHKINPDLTNPEAFAYLDKAGASMCIDSLRNTEPASEAQRVSLAHNASFTYEGLSREERATMDRAWAIASPTGDPANPDSYRHLTKRQASEALSLLIDG